jgi:hypothetical protein
MRITFVLGANSQNNRLITKWVINEILTEKYRMDFILFIERKIAELLNAITLSCRVMQMASSTHALGSGMFSVSAWFDHMVLMGCAVFSVLKKSLRMACKKFMFLAAIFAIDIPTFTQPYMC